MDRTKVSSIAERGLSPRGERRHYKQKHNPASQQREEYLTFRDIRRITPGLTGCVNEAARFADKDITILITGETGTGKEVMAQAIHAASKRSNGPCIAINCGAIPEKLVGSALFGHVRGAFTGAEDDHRGFFEQADGGTLFLDEIGELPLEQQVQLLRVLDNQKIRPLGSEEERKVNVRIIAATNCDLEEAVKTGKFREDLFYRLNIVRVEMPPLRDRPQDIAPLAQYFAMHFAVKHSRTTPGFTPKAQAFLFQSASIWKGNVRGLRNAIERAVILCRGSCIDVKDMISDGAYSGTRVAPSVSADTASRSTVTEVAGPGVVLPDLSPGDDMGSELRLVDAYGNFRLGEWTAWDLAHFAYGRASGNLTEAARWMHMKPQGLRRVLEEKPATLINPKNPRYRVGYVDRNGLWEPREHIEWQMANAAWEISRHSKSRAAGLLGVSIPVLQHFINITPAMKAAGVGRDSLVYSSMVQPGGYVVSAGQMRRHMVLAALNYTQGRKGDACSLLGMGLMKMNALIEAQPVADDPHFHVRLSDTQTREETELKILKGTLVYTNYNIMHAAGLLGRDREEIKKKCKAGLLGGVGERVLNRDTKAVRGFWRPGGEKKHTP